MMHLGRLLNLAAGAVALSCAACSSGLQLIPIPINQPLPAELQTRRVFRSVGVYQKNPAPLVGHVLFVKKASDGSCPKVYEDAELSLRSYLNQGVTIVPDNSATLRYQSAIDRRASTQGSYLIFSADFSNDQTAEVVVTDTTSAAAADADIDVEALEGLATTGNSGDCERFFIRGVVLTTVARKLYSKVDANATAGGTVFAAGGNVYGQGNSYSLDLMIGLNVLALRPNMETSRSGSELTEEERHALERLQLQVPSNGFRTRE